MEKEIYIKLTATAGMKLHKKDAEPKDDTIANIFRCKADKVEMYEEITDAQANEILKEKESIITSE